METVRYAVYAPPCDGLPFLSVMVPEIGPVRVKSFRSRAEAGIDITFFQTVGERLPESFRVLRERMMAEGFN
ncbi:MAG: hypothetical protein WDN03_18745 [Rhizomicrobium sp.]